jgi:excisionase family DNA binding protein
MSDDASILEFAPIPRASDILGPGRSTLYELAAQGKIRMIKVGKRTLVDMPHAIAYFRSLPTAKIGKGG